MTTTIMEQKYKTPFDDEWRKLITYAKNSGISKRIYSNSYKKIVRMNDVTSYKNTILTSF
jgi:hypothetical protein